MEQIGGAERNKKNPQQLHRKADPPIGAVLAERLRSEPAVIKQLYVNSKHGVA